MGLSLRPIQDTDEAFLLEVYASTRESEMALVDWNDEQKQAFLRMQFDAQRGSYQQQSPAAEYQVIQKDGIDAGRLITDVSGKTIRIIDIAVLPKFRNQGIGSSLIKDFQALAEKEDRPISLHVESFNPAFRLYERLGFNRVEEIGFYWRMEWTPEARMKPAAAQG